MRTHHLIFIAGLSVAFAAPVRAQSVVKKVADDTHHVLKTTGRDIKEDAKAVGSDTHKELQKAGNGTKTVLGNTTGIHKVGGTVGAAAQTVSRTGKHVARSAKHGVKRTTTAVHHDLKKDGNDTKAAIKP